MNTESAGSRLKANGYHLFGLISRKGSYAFLNLYLTEQHDSYE